MRIVTGSKIIIEIPVIFKNHSKSPGLKRGGVLNIVRRKVELRCPTDKIPDNITVDLDGTDIGTSIKISSVKLSEDVKPTISDRDFVIATVAAPTVIKEPEKPAEGEAVEGAEVPMQQQLKALMLLRRKKQQSHRKMKKEKTPGVIKQKKHLKKNQLEIKRHQKKIIIYAFISWIRKSRTKQYK